VKAPAKAQVNRAHFYLLPKWGEGFAHMLRLGEYVENKFDGSFELSMTRISRSFGNSITADLCRLGVTAGLQKTMQRDYKRYRVGRCIGLHIGG
jgi:hypothetical protein